ncbi:hypothetical protein [Terrihalobacillus insolitus]|uniref:hypothetical protein n=1 Tax=Terrihalobacillus insolitus TaxID=2950438 RepID=UPI002341215C|nr:hypothetical protein [Terrihalobacillus insolitus]MDC3412927.1 hypothetical protein [Terrihalobacillus insolitus]
MDEISLRKKIIEGRLELEIIAVESSMNLLDQRVLEKSKELDQWTTLYTRLWSKSIKQGGMKDGEDK